MPPTSPNIIKLLGKALDLLDKWNLFHARTMALWEAISNLEAQISATQTYIAQDVDDDDWRNPYTTPSLILKFPDIPNRLIKKQIAARESQIQKIGVEIEAIEPVMKALTALNKDLAAKASAGGSQNTKYHNPALITLLELSKWTDDLLYCYRREFCVRKELVQSYTSGIDIERIRDRWMTQDEIDQSIEIEMRERFKLHQAIANKI